MSVEVSIEKVVVHGLGIEVRHAAEVGRAIRIRLTQLTGQTPRDTWHGRAGDAPVVRAALLPSGDGPTGLGIRIADSIHAAITETP